MKLYGSKTSPYVRRLRLWMEEVEHEFIHLNIFETEDRERLCQLNPALKIPLLVDDWQAVFDSREIFHYLNHQLQREVTTVDDENTLTLIHAAGDAFIELYLLSKSGFDVEEDRLFFNLQRERITSTFAVLEQQAAVGDFSHWNYPAMALFSLLDWLLFRELFSLEAYPALQAFYQSERDRPIVKATDPRL
ncbi:glutathione S-transferase family protein [Nitrincola tapanii]|uniref:Glutathione S-transferase family protein n=1 Tax=Nitrincola tapanii TaxID=1708751 RepID=A0A5A9W0Z5_9GAMM|nr:glutathione S-transferase family protein [Nitrincola tapanii]KAA0874223.1 glutathione S-transferase family protein [Nitrincola tapanii]